MNPKPDSNPLPNAQSGSSSLAARVVDALRVASREYLDSIGVSSAPAPAAPAVAPAIAPIPAAEPLPEPDLQLPRNPEHGDWAANIAMKLAKIAGRKPLEIAEGIRARLEAAGVVGPAGLLASVETAPPGFINLRVGPRAMGEIMAETLAKGDRYGRAESHSGERVLVEFVSANPTGPLHVGHGRNAIVGDALARVYEAAGYAVEREYYYNDAGVQMGLLGRSLRARYLQVCGRDEPDAVLPEDGYKGDYMLDIARDLQASFGETKTTETDTRFFTAFAAEAIMRFIRADLDDLGVRFDRYFLESAMHADGRVENILKALADHNATYEDAGALWLRTTDHGDEKDRVLRKSDGTKTYLTPDVAYHRDKFERGYSRMVNVLGGDHHGYVLRLKAAVRALGFDPEKLRFVLIQMVSVKSGGEIRKLSTRSGDFVTLREIIDELGPELTRFFYLLRAPDSQMVFDLDLAKQMSKDNPYWYVQYAHARCANILRQAAERGAAWRGGADARPELLTAPEERAILFQVSRLPEAIVEAARKDDPLTVVNYLRELATPFHSHFAAGNKDKSLRFIQETNPDLNEARLTLIAALRQALANGLRALGLTPVDRLEKRDDPEE